LQTETLKEAAECDPAVGLVAEDVEKVDPNLIARDHEGKLYTGSLRSGPRYAFE